MNPATVAGYVDQIRAAEAVLGRGDLELSAAGSTGRQTFERPADVMGRMLAGAVERGRPISRENLA